MGGANNEMVKRAKVYLISISTDVANTLLHSMAPLTCGTCLSPKNTTLVSRSAARVCGLSSIFFAVSILYAIHTPVTKEKHCSASTLLPTRNITTANTANGAYLYFLSAPILWDM